MNIQISQKVLDMFLKRVTISERMLRQMFETDEFEILRFLKIEKVQFSISFQDHYNSKLYNGLSKLLNLRVLISYKKLILIKNTELTNLILSSMNIEELIIYFKLFENKLLIKKANELLKQINYKY